MMATEKRVDLNEQQDRRMTVTTATVGSPSADTALIDLLRSRQRAAQHSILRRFAFGCAIGFVPAVWLWGNVFDVHFHEVTELILGEPEQAATESAASLHATHVDVASEVKDKGPSEEYKAMLRESGVGLDSSRLRDAQSIAREAFPEGW
jgi:hypothetical protein